MGAQHQRDRCGVLTLPFETQPDTAEAAQHEPGLERAQDRSGEQSFALHPLHQLRVAARDVAGEDVVVTRERLGGAGHHEIGAQRQRLLPQRRGGGVVDDQQRAAGAAGHRQLVQIHDVQTRVGRRLGQHHIAAAAAPRVHISAHLASTTVTPRGARNSFA